MENEINESEQYVPEVEEVSGSRWPFFAATAFVVLLIAVAAVTGYRVTSNSRKSVLATIPPDATRVTRTIEGKPNPRNVPDIQQPAAHLVSSFPVVYRTNYSGVFEPTQDITAYELAMVMRMVGAEITQELIAKTPPNIFRHIRITGTNVIPEMSTESPKSLVK